MSKGPAYNRFLQDKPGVGNERLPYRVSPPPARTYPNPPKVHLPPGACDSHVHVLGPHKRFPPATNRIRGPFSDVIFEDSTVEDLVKMLDACGMSRAIFVGSMLYGDRYDPMIHALTRLPDRLRGIAILDPAMTDRELQILDSVGVVGARISAAYSPEIDLRLIARISEMGWSPNYITEDWSRWRQTVLDTPGKFIIEHMGNLDPSAGLDQPTMKFLLECLDTGRCWVKLSARMSHQEDFPFSDMLPYVHKLVEYAPNRLLWGSDWPHPVYFGRPMPNDVDLVDMLLDWVPDEATRNRTMVDNGVEAYGWAL